MEQNMKLYEYYLYSDENAYGQPALITDESGKPVAQGTLKIAIFNTATSTQDNINYKDANYLGLTHDSRVSDKYVIAYGTEKLKVLYIQPHGRYRQVFLEAM